MLHFVKWGTLQLVKCDLVKLIHCDFDHHILGPPQSWAVVKVVVYLTCPNSEMLHFVKWGMLHFVK